MTEEIKNAIRAKALEMGFDVARFAKPVDKTDQLKKWLDAGYHGDMTWMENNPDVRGSATTMWGDVRTVISLGYNYGPDADPRPKLENKDAGYISVYAHGDDYHDIVKKKLKKLGNWMAQTYGNKLKVFVDTAPVMEKPLAHEAGVGWQGKHSNVVSRQFGSWLFLGTIYIDLDLPADDKETDHCGSCRKCLDACPTNAFPEPYVLDARKCISYLTIENKGPIPHEFRKAIGNRIYGCDDCLAACPWNKFAQTSTEMAFMPREELKAPKLRELAQLDDASFREMFRKSPIKRIKRERFVRNVLIAIGNSDDPTLLDVVEPLMADPDPVVAEAAEWAKNELENPQST